MVLRADDVFVTWLIIMKATSAETIPATVWNGIHLEVYEIPETVRGPRGSLQTEL